MRQFTIFILCSWIISVWLSSCVTPPQIRIAPELAECQKRPNRFISYENNTVLDTCTQLMWMTHDYRNIEGEAPSRWRDALAWVNTINQQRYGSYSDWRAATREDYETIYNPQKTRLSYRGKPVGYPDVFSDGGGEWYWVKEVAALGSGHLHQAHTFNFRSGQQSQEWVDSESHPQPRYTRGSIRLVRGPLPSSISSGAK